MTLTDPQHSKCLPCRRGRCAGCLWKSRPNDCSCLCAWLIADVVERFSSLRRLWLEETNE